MPTNKHAQHRYAIIDDCLRRTQQHWTIKKLLQAVSEAHNELTGSTQGISLRTLRDDLRNMKPGGATRYDAPIMYDPSRGYYYEKDGFSIFNTPLTGDDLVLLHQSLQPLRALQGLGLATELNELIQRLEQRLPASGAAAITPILQLEPTPNYLGTQYLQPLYKAIQEHQTVLITYRPYGADVSEYVVHPYLLKVYNHRWFLLANNSKQKAGLSTYALDRIESVRSSNAEYVPSDVDFATHFQNIIGVTLPTGALPELIKLRFSSKRAPYVLTKPIHHSQRFLSENPDGTEVEMKLVLNPEFLTILLSFGPDLQVIEPEHLRDSFARKLSDALKQYQ